MNNPWGMCHQCPCLHSEPQLTLVSPGDPLRPTSKLAQAFMESLLFPGSHCIETLSAPSKNEVSVSPSPTELLLSGPAGLQNQIRWGLFLLFMLDTLAWEPDKDQNSQSLGFPCGSAGKESTCNVGDLV